MLYASVDCHLIQQKNDIEKFFDGMEITNNGILMTSDYQGRSSGEAYVQFSSKQDGEKALEKNKQSIGHRYIEVFRSSMVEAQRAQYGGGGGGGRPGPYDRGMGGAPLGRGFGAGGPGMRGPGRQMKNFGNDGGYGGGGGFGNYSDDVGFGNGGGGFGGGGFGGGGEGFGGGPMGGGGGFGGGGRGMGNGGGGGR